MSLINDVLRNLEATRPDELNKQQLQREIRPLPPAARRHGGTYLLLGAGLAGALGIALWQGVPGRLPETLLATPAPALPSAPAPVPETSSASTAAPVPIPAPAPAPVPETPLPPLVSPDLPPPAALPPAERVVVPVSAPTVTPAQTPIPAVALRSAAAPANGPGTAASPAAVVQPKAPSAAPPAPAPIAVLAAAVAPTPPSVPAARIEMSPAPATPRDRADGEWRRGEAALAAGRGEEGREALRAALRHDPGHLQVRQALLRHLLEARRIDEAIGVLQEGLERQPAQTGWAMPLARLQLDQGDVAAAEATLVRSQAYAENSADYAGFQGHLQTRLGKHRQAAAHYQRATVLAANDGRWWLALGLALESDGRAMEGREALHRALASGNLSAELTTVAEQHLR